MRPFLRRQVQSQQQHSSTSITGSLFALRPFTDNPHAGAFGNTGRGTLGNRRHSHIVDPRMLQAAKQQATGGLDTATARRFQELGPDAAVLGEDADRDDLLRRDARARPADNEQEVLRPFSEFELSMKERLEKGDLPPWAKFRQMPEHVRKPMEDRGDHGIDSAGNETAERKRKRVREMVMQERAAAAERAHRRQFEKQQEQFLQHRSNQQQQHQYDIGTAADDATSRNNSNDPLTAAEDNEIEHERKRRERYHSLKPNPEDGLRKKLKQAFATQMDDINEEEMIGGLSGFARPSQDELLKQKYEEELREMRRQRLRQQRTEEEENAARARRQQQHPQPDQQQQDNEQQQADPRQQAEQRTDDETFSVKLGAKESQFGMRKQNLDHAQRRGPDGKGDREVYVLNRWVPRRVARDFVVHSKEHGLEFERQNIPEPVDINRDASEIGRSGDPLPFFVFIIADPTLLWRMFKARLEWWREQRAAQKNKQQTQQQQQRADGKTTNPAAEVPIEEVETSDVAGEVRSHANPSRRVRHFDEADENERAAAGKRSEKKPTGLTEEDEEWIHGDPRTVNQQVIINAAINCVLVTFTLWWIIGVWAPLG